MRPSVTPLRFPTKPLAAPAATSPTPKNETTGGHPVAQAEPLEPEGAGDERDEDRERPEEERDRRRGGQAHRVGERDLVQEDPEHRRDDEQQDVAALDAERVLTREREAGEDRGAEREADGRVGERLPPVRQRVLDDREVEAPEQDRDEEQDVRGDAVAHGARTLAVPPSGQAGSDPGVTALGPGHLAALLRVARRDLRVPARRHVTTVDPLPAWVRRRVTSPPSSGSADCDPPGPRPGTRHRGRSPSRHRTPASA